MLPTVLREKKDYATSHLCSTHSAAKFFGSSSGLGCPCSVMGLGGHWASPGTTPFVSSPPVRSEVGSAALMSKCLLGARPVQRDMTNVTTEDLKTVQRNAVTPQATSWQLWISRLRSGGPFGDAPHIHKDTKCPTLSQQGTMCP